MPLPKLIEVDIHGDKFRYTTNGVDLGFLGFHAIRVSKIYTSTICINNLYDLANMARKMDWHVSYTDAAQPVRKLLLDEFKRIREGSKYLTMLKDDIEAEWDKRADELYEKIPLDIYQKRTVLYGLHIKRGCLFLDMGLGKSAIAATIAQILKNNKLISRGSILIVAPKTLHKEDNWEGEIDKFSDLTILNLRDDINDIKNPYADCFIINADQFRILCRKSDITGTSEYDPFNILAQKKFECVFFDEAVMLRGHDSLVRKTFQELSKNFKYTFLMSGLPAPNTIFQLWGLASCVGNWLGDSYTAFEQRYGKIVQLPVRSRKSNSVKKIDKFVPRRDVELEIKNRMSYISIYLTAEENLDLPAYHCGPEFNIYAKMPKEMEDVYQEFEHEYYTVIENKEGEEVPIYVDNESAARFKLIQLMAGFVYKVDEFKNKTVVWMPHNPKFDAMVNQLRIDLADPTNNVIIWTRFRAELEGIYEDLSKEWLCAYGYGGMTDSKMKEQLDLWLHNDKCRIMIAHPGAFMYGHTWLKANFSYYSSPIDDNNQYSQSRKRNMRRGQTREVTERRVLLTGTLEDQIWTSIRMKVRLDRFLKGLLNNK